MEILFMKTILKLPRIMMGSIPKKKKCKNEKRLSVEALQIAKKRREGKGKRRKEKIHPSECRVPETTKER